MSNKRIFICDDDRGITDMLKVVFELSSIDVVVENNSVLAYDSVNQLRPDLLIVDLWMPVVSGDMLVKKIKDNPDLKDIFVICISASTNGEVVAAQAGADLFVSKPFDLDHLLAVVDRVFSAA